MDFFRFYFIMFVSSISCVVSYKTYDTENVELIVTLFRHGDRTPESTELYPKDPYLQETHYPFGSGQLTNAGKRKEYSIGKQLRDRYDDFLGDYYTPDIVEARSTDYNRTKMSLLLVLASLFPPRGVEKWQFDSDSHSSLNWQPIPFNYEPRNTDKVLMGFLCPNYVKSYNDYIKTPKMQRKFRQYQSIFSYISRNTGLKVKTFDDVYRLYFGLSTEEELGFKLPRWTNSVWPIAITNLAIEEYGVHVGTTNLARMAAGYFLQKVLNDIKAKQAGNTPARKVYLYSAHENNIADVLVTLGVYPYRHVPSYGAYLTFEVHKLGKNKSGIKLLYQNYQDEAPQELILPGCTRICEVDEFEQLIEEYLPDEDLCGN